MRRTLFTKIFLWFWLASTFISVVSTIVTISVDPDVTTVSRYEKQILNKAKVLIGVYEQQGAAALAEQSDSFEREAHISIFLFKGSQGPLSGRDVRFEGRQAVITAAAIGAATNAPSGRGVWYASPVGDGYIVLAELPPPMPMDRFFQPELMGFRLSVSFVVAGIFCYLLARSLTAPILQLRKAARQFAGGDLETRVGSVLKKRADEIADLGWDFDRMAERIGALVDAQQKLLRDISHELRSPLARLNVALELARRCSNPDAEKALDRIERESERLNELITQLLTLTLLESGTEKIETTPINLADLIDLIVEDSDFEARDRNRLVKVISCEEIIVTGSQEMLRRAVENVIRNAIRYTAEGTAAEVSLKRVVKDNRNFAGIRVRDHGPGVPEEALTKVFQPFYRVADARDRLSGGTGIGLAITERSVHLHGGTVVASNAPGGGLLVEIVLPVSEDQPLYQ